jgi:hypothetical protein
LIFAIQKAKLLVHLAGIEELGLPKCFACRQTNFEALPKECP